MTVELQIKLNSDPRLLSFIREYPIWYKRLNRNPDLYKEFISDMKDKYHLKPSDKFTKTINDISMIQNILEVLK